MSDESVQAGSLSLTGSSGVIGWELRPARSFYRIGFCRAVSYPFQLSSPVMPHWTMQRPLFLLLAAAIILSGGCASLFSEKMPECNPEHELASPATFSIDGPSDSLRIVVFGSERGERLSDAWVRAGKFEQQTNDRGFIRFSKPSVDTVKVDYLGSHYTTKNGTDVQRYGSCHQTRSMPHPALSCFRTYLD